jgi:hypothetical protein
MVLGIRDYSQWFLGKDNIIANILSRDDNRLDKELTLIFCTDCPSQIPDHFKILPLPNKNHLVADCVAAQVASRYLKNTQGPSSVVAPMDNLLPVDRPCQPIPQQLPQARTNQAL